MVGGISNSMGANGSLLDMLRSLQEEEQDFLEQSTRDVLASIVPQENASSFSGSPNMMASHFPSAVREESPYIAAILNKFAVERQMEASKASEALSAIPEAVKEAAFWYGDRRMRQTKMLKDSIESNEESLAGIKGNIEQKAQEALAPKDASEVPIEGLATGSDGDAPAPEGTAPLPGVDVMGSTPDINVPDVQSSTSAPVSPSIDITV